METLLNSSIAGAVFKTEDCSSSVNEDWLYPGYPTNTLPIPNALLKEHQRKQQAQMQLSCQENSQNRQAVFQPAHGQSRTIEISQEKIGIFTTAPNNLATAITIDQRPRVGNVIDGRLLSASSHGTFFAATPTGGQNAVSFIADGGVVTPTGTTLHCTQSGLTFLPSTITTTTTAMTVDPIDPSRPSSSGQPNSLPNLDFFNGKVSERSCNPSETVEDLEMNSQMKSKRRYIVSSNEKREALLKMVTEKNVSIRRASEMLKIKYSTAKMILLVYRREGRIKKKIKE
eukprot:CAMPEP_0115017474 /NCGR_PEP_ID=MMETSP0216-20121206/28150_1 /TAXON_ID=223996 /ORGANISM="Protocruzia adherens, Strain Boccale" /LENGTH=285 /DNA_ID=CAMNT_0002388321 /DNA_START=404 /DNA_END=1261 /DNA_ORIENTATION=-